MTGTAWKGGEIYLKNHVAVTVEGTYATKELLVVSAENHDLVVVFD